MKTLDKAQFDQQNVFGQGMANTAFAAYFIGQFLFESADQGRRKPAVGRWQTLPLSLAAATTGTSTMPKAGGGQILICTAGEGWYQEEGKGAVSACTPGTVIVIPPEVKALARRQGRQLVFPHRSGSARRRDQPMNGWNRWTTPALPNCRDRSSARAAGCRPPKEYAQARRGGGLFPREKTGLAPALPGERSFAL